MATAVELWLSLNGANELALSIPIGKCQELAVYPLKWLRFLGYAIYGQPGYLSMSATGPIDDYTANIVACHYYFISEGQPRLADVDLIDDRTSNASNLSICRADFRSRIIERDGTCVCTGELPRDCNACHIIPHSKGNDYLVNALSYRSGPNNVEELDGIDDIRNGFLLSTFLHRPFGDGSLAFLKTPNLYLSVNDIPYNKNHATPTSRTTSHYIVDTGLSSMMPVLVPNNSDLREPTDISQWPPAEIINLFYISAAIQAWAPPSFKQTVQESVQDIYYNSSDDATSDGEPSDIGPCTHPDVARTRRNIARNNRKAHSEETELGSLMHGIMGLWMQSAEQRKENEERIIDSDLVHSKVNMWMDSQGE
ncbi:hypothetical protein BYT27DRAFT_7199581 [Phlegmacium glaucopus]|nr:hypothetical protein BYT27DRAFT_7199581 [Phlegmacium glaucopus]